MSEIERAISEIKHSGLYGNQVHQETMELALQALQEKAEREKGCGHCKTHDDFQADMIVFENGNEKVEVQLCFGMLEIIHKRDEEVIYHVDTEINFCPMCGRKLVEE